MVVRRSGACLSLAMFLGACNSWLAGREAAAQTVSPGDPITVSNWTFDPTVPSEVAGLPPFDLPWPETVPSVLQLAGEPVDYWLVQAAGSMSDLRQALDAAGYQRLGEHRLRTILVRIPESAAGSLTGLAAVEHAVEYLPAYKAAPVFEDLILGAGLVELLDEDGVVRFMAAWHRGESIAVYLSPSGTLLESQLPATARIDATVVATGQGGAAESQLLAVAVSPGPNQEAETLATLSVLLGVEGIAALRTWADAQLPADFEAGVTALQVGEIPPATFSWDFDEPLETFPGYFAKPLARGLNGRGELIGITDRGFTSAHGADEIHICRFRYGPNPSDRPPPLTRVPAPTLPGTAGGVLRPHNKVVATISIEPAPSCPPRDPAHWHGWNSAFWAASESPRVVAARAGRGGWGSTVGA